MGAIAENLWVVGAVIVLLVLIKAFLIALDGVRQVRHRQVQREREAELFDLRVAAAKKRRGEEDQQTLMWAGWRKFEIRTKELEDTAAQVCSFYLVPHDGKPVPSYQPGQFLTFALNIPGQSKSVVRCYSLSDSAKPDHYRVTIKRLPPPRNNPDAPPGLASNFFHDQIKEGDILDVKAPAGRFVLETSNTAPVVLIGGGVGITPVLSMLSAIAESGDNRETWFFYGVRHKGEHIMKEHLDNIARERPNVHVHICYSDPRAEDVPGADYHHAERISVDLLKRLLPSNNYHFFLCGPPPMMEALVQGIADWDVSPEHIHLEKFGPASAKKTKKKVVPTAAGPAVTFRKAGKIIKWDASAEHLWEFARANEVVIESGCLEGNCGTCATAILSGEVEYTRQPGFECEEQTCLVCCCVPKGPLELDA